MESEEAVKFAEPVGPVESVKLAEPVESGKSLEPIDSVESVEPVDSVESVVAGDWRSANGWSRRSGIW
ncbi:hypothetical protein [Streptomyces crystallinus]|uniref:hypothetical protein n=1 Tax=Streptomyces crystallinus TaxID=68191 RepID=UPI0031DA4ADE